MKLLLLALFAALSAHADPLEVDKTQRMAEIEQKYHMAMAGILRTPGRTDCWVFMITEPGISFSTYPVTVVKDSTDHDVDVAIIAASHCAVFYESNMKPVPTH
jgi:hypothetical protein